MASTSYPASEAAQFEFVPLIHDVISTNLPCFLLDCILLSLPSSDIDYSSDSKDLVHHSEDILLYWAPEDCRDDLFCPAILTIPTDGHQPTARLNLQNSDTVLHGQMSIQRKNNIFINKKHLSTHSRYKSISIFYKARHIVSFVS